MIQKIVGDNGIVIGCVVMLCIVASDLRRCVRMIMMSQDVYDD